MKIYSSAYNEGYRAYDAQVERIDNPYRQDSIQHENWEAGWWDRHYDVQILNKKVKV